LISEDNKGKNLVVILDHYNPSPSKDLMVYDMNLENFGIRGESDFSSSTCFYLFYRELDGNNSYLSYSAIVGCFEIPQCFIGINAEVLEKALNEGIVVRKGIFNGIFSRYRY